MNAARADTYARDRLLELLGIERVVPRGAAPDPVSPTYAIACGDGDADRYAKFIRHVARAIGIDAAAFTGRAANAAHTICFGTAPPDGPATLAPPLAALRASPQAKRAFWRTLRDLKRARR